MTCHAPRERVSWNIGSVIGEDIDYVTLHVSVWVEILVKIFNCYFDLSRSTWACELKCFLYCLELNSNSHAPRERVSWNSDILIVSCMPRSHAPRERVSWNSKFITLLPRPPQVTLHVSVWVEMMIIQTNSWQDIVTLHVSVWVEICCHFNRLSAPCRHAPRERVSWNCRRDRHIWRCDSHAPRERVSWNWHSPIPPLNSYVTLHVSVWVEILIPFMISCIRQSRSTWACELKCRTGRGWIWRGGSRSTWACELKLFLLDKCQAVCYVTLHVSVWVEISPHSLPLLSCSVTLHVSVWVEIKICPAWIVRPSSRSTWACELKSFLAILRKDFFGHAPRERVSWNATRWLCCDLHPSHAPRERVSWN